MFQEIPVTEDNIYAYRATGKLTDADYQQFLSELTSLTHKFGPLSLLIELDDFKGWEPQAAWDNFRFGKEHADDFERIAIVGDKGWQKWMTALGNAFTDTKIRFYKHDDLRKAWGWLRDGDDSPEENSSADVNAEPTPSEPLELKPYAHILVAVDFTPYSDLALQRGAELAKHYNARLSLVHSVTPVDYPGLNYDFLAAVPSGFLEADREIFDASEKRLEEFVKNLDLPDVQQKVVWGTPKAAILSFAEAQKVDLIVTGSHGHHGLARLLGSTANGVVHGACCDVVVVRLAVK